MLDKEGNSIDAVIVTIPDHMHATAASIAWSVGARLHASRWCTIKEARLMVEAANKYKVATQMGSRATREGTRQCAEMIWSGEIGNVTEVHAWTDRPIWPQGLTAIPVLRPFPRLWIGICGWALPTSAITLRAAKAIRKRASAAIFISRSTGAASTISDAARWATWHATSWARPTWR
jgi:hypothetical protein